MPATGLAHVATASFLASRAVPTGGFAVALAGGVALARAAQQRGLRSGFGASLAATLQTIAIMGPTRLSVPLTQALTAPLLGRMEARGHGAVAQTLLTIAIRAVENAIAAAFYVFVIVSVDAFTGSYTRLLGWLPFAPEGTAGVVLLTAIGLAGWSIGASVVQVLVYRRGLHRWPADPPAPEAAPVAAAPADAAPPAEGPVEGPGADVAPAGRPEDGSPPRPPHARFDPRAIVLAGTVAFGILLTGTWWPLLAAVAGWLAVAWILARGDRSVVKPGLVLAAILVAGTLVAGLVGGIGIDETLRRTARAALLVLVATWLRYAAGEAGLREVFRRMLRRAERLPSVREAWEVLEGLGSTDALARSGRRLVARVKGVPPEVLPLTDAVLDWVAGEAGRHEPDARAPQPVALRARRRDAALVVLAASCSLALPFVV